MEGDLLAPGRRKRRISAGQQRHKHRALGPRLIRYSVQMGKEPDLADIISASIDRWYESAEDFARKAGVTGSTVSRMVNRKGVPSARILERIAPYVLDSKGRPVPARTLVALAYPSLAAPGDAKPIAATRDIHPLAVELDRLIGDGSPLEESKRSNLVQLADMLITPYRSYLRRRKAG